MSCCVVGQEKCEACVHLVRIVLTTSSCNAFLKFRTCWLQVCALGPMANRMQSSQDVKPEEQDDHKIDDDDKCDDVSCPKLKRCLLAQQSDDGGGLPKFKKQKHRPDDDKVINDDKSDYDVACPKLKRWIAEGDAGCSPKFKKQKHHEGDAGFSPKLKRWIAEGDAGCSPKFK